MEILVQTLLADLSHQLDRLAEELDRDRPVLARTLRREAARTAPLAAPEPRRLARPLTGRPGALRPLLYRALEDGAVDAQQFDRLMTVAARARR